MNFPKVAIIGTGNLAIHLAKSVEKAGFKVSEVSGRTLSKAKAIASQLYDASAMQSLNFQESQARFFFLCVSDSAIEDVARTIELPKDAVLIHCSGATSLDSIKRKDVHYGVFYPVQTFSQKHKVHFENVSICIEGSDDETEEGLEFLAKKMGANPCFMTSEQRLVLHLSAVFACNFSNHFYRIAQELLAEQGLPFGLLQVLVQETVNKAFANGPDLSQTGPAAREDYDTMSKHEEIMESHPEWKALYLQISEDIIKHKA